MTPAARIAGFAAVLAALFAVGAFAGAKIDPSVGDGGPMEGMEGMGEMNGHGMSTEEPSGAVAPPGLAVGEAGYRLVPERTTLGAPGPAELRFRIVDRRDETVRDFDLEHTRRMHLIVVRLDFTDFQHLHPRQLGDGGWVAEADLRAGTYRAFADFSTSGRSLTLGTDLFAPGRFEPEPLPAVSRTADAGDGYEVSLDAAAPGIGTGLARFTVTRDGREVDSVEPYLGADGHLVALREHDQAFLHTHPEGKPGGAGPIAFQVEYPSPGRYRLFLQFKHDGVVRTAAFTQAAGGTAAPVSESDPDPEGAGHGGH